MSIAAYQSVQRVADGPRRTEYRLFADVTRALIEAGERGDKGEAFHHAVTWNREVWQTLANDLLQPGNSLPDALKAQLLSLALWVDRHSLRVMRNAARSEPLVEVNRNVMAGLQG